MELDNKICSLHEFEKHKAYLDAELRAWANEQVDLHQDPDLTGVPKGSGGSILGLGNPISSKRVLEASAITEEIIGMPIPPAIITKGGYETADAFVEKILVGLENVVRGKIKVRLPKTKAMSLVSA